MIVLWLLVVVAVCVALVLIERWARAAGERVRRRVCAREGHVWVESHHGEPVTEFECCLRCGKIGARL